MPTSPRMRRRPMPRIKTVGGRFALHQLIGSGACSHVYLATDTVTKKKVAVKLFKQTSPMSRGQSIYQANMEARIMAACDHPNVMPMHQTVHSKELICIVMPFVEGHDLFECVSPASAEPCTVTETMRWLAQVASGLAHVHARNIIHGDIKPENILIDTNTGQALVCDFGLAKLAVSYTTQRPEGTLPYMAPEMLDGTCSCTCIHRKYHKVVHTCAGVLVTQAVDVWALGLVLYATLYADLPWDAASPTDKDYAYYCKTGVLPAPSKNKEESHSKETHALLRAMLNPIPAKRPTMQQVADCLSGTDSSWLQFLELPSDEDDVQFDSLPPTPASQVPTYPDIAQH
eukprot:m.355795 g.355795  ORF g.355795 m.355795 type:complete len:344 (-) comp17343_c0_seq1:445-1476(-)